MDPYKQQVCNDLGLRVTHLFEHKHVKPMTHVYDNARIVFSFVLEQVS